MKRARRLTMAVLLAFAGTATVACSGGLLGDYYGGDSATEFERSWTADEPDESSGDEERTEHGDEISTLSGNTPDRLDRPDEFRVPGSSPDFAAHEWGTFTSVVSSDGSYLPGLHHEEESLPAFVDQFEYRGIGESTYAKGVPFVYLPEPVTQKLETPVIYFYSDEAREVSVDVDFPEGYITEWYPDSVEQHPETPEQCPSCTDEMDRERYGLDELADGRMKWDVELTNQKQDLIDVPPEDIWAPSRQVPEASYVRHGGDAEKFIFYRGVGQFEPPFTARAKETSSGQPEFTFINRSEQRIPNVYLMRITEDRGRIVSLSSIEAGGSKTHMPAPKEMPKEEFVEHAKSTVKSGLVETGLTEAESEAMVETWSRSYFRKSGYRVLYILPREWTDRMLPIEIEPTPDELVRTIVGRMEVLTPSQERRTLERVREAVETGESLSSAFDGNRFGEPRLRRACQLATDSNVKSSCNAAVENLRRSVIYEAEDGG